MYSSVILWKRVKTCINSESFKLRGPSLKLRLFEAHSHIPTMAILLIFLDIRALCGMQPSKSQWLSSSTIVPTSAWFMPGFGLELLFCFSSNYLFTYLFPFLPFSSFLKVGMQIWTLVVYSLGMKNLLFSTPDHQFQFPDRLWRKQCKRCGNIALASGFTLLKAIVPTPE